MTSVTLRQAILALVAPAVASGAIQPGDATRLAAAWNAFVATGELPPERVAGALFIVPKGSQLETSMAREIPIGFDGIQTFRPADYDGPISATVTAGDGSVAPEGDSGAVFRVTLADGAAEGDTLTVMYSADERHGAGVKETDDEVTYTIVAADADPLTEAGFDVVGKGQPAPAGG